MQTLWSRTGLSHRCACRACEQVLGAGRRATTRATRRKATFAEAFTALYSSICATAAVVDAVRKEDRKSKVDAELVEVRDQLIELRAQRALRELERGIPDERPYGDIIEPSDLSDIQNRALWEQWRYIIDSPGFLDDCWRMSGSEEVTIHASHVRPFGGSRVEATTILRGACTRVMRHIEAEEQDDAVKQRVFKKLVHYETNVAHVRAYVKSMLVMAERIFQEYDRPRENSKEYQKFRKRPSQRDTSERGQTGGEWQQLISDLRHHEPADASNAHRSGFGGNKIQSRNGDMIEDSRAGTPDFTSEPKSQPTQHRWMDKPLAATLQRAWTIFNSPVRKEWYHGSRFQKENTIQLNNHIRALLQDHSIPMHDCIAEICICLLISPSMPDVHTHNLLMAGFTRRRWRILADKSYELFFSEENKLRSTPASLAMSVTKPAMFWDIPGFKRAAAALVGRDPFVGAKIARRPLAQVVEDEFVARWATDSARRGIAGRAIWEFAPMDLALREALISSLLHLRQHVDAASFFLACLQTGASIAPGVIFDVFNAIAKIPDARSALRLVRGLSVRYRDFEAMLWTLPDVIRGCVCRRLEYLMYVLDVRNMDLPEIDEIISGLGLCRRHIERLHDLLDEQGFSNALMNKDRGSFGMYDDVTRNAARAIKSPKIQGARNWALEMRSGSMSKDLEISLDSNKLASRIHEQIRDTVHAEIERQLHRRGLGEGRVHIEAQLRRKSSGLSPNEGPDAVKPSNGDSVREQTEADIEGKVRTLIQMQVQEQLGKANTGGRDMDRGAQPERMIPHHAQAEAYP